MRIFFFLLLIISFNLTFAQDNFDWIIKPQNITKFEMWRENMFIAQKGNKMGLIDVSGNEILPYQFDNIIQIDEYAIALVKNGKYELVHYKLINKKKLNFEFKFIPYYSEDTKIILFIAPNTYKAHSYTQNYQIAITDEELKIIKLPKLDNSDLIRKSEYISKPSEPTTPYIVNKNVNLEDLNRDHFWSKNYKYITKYNINENNKSVNYFVVNKENIGTGLIDSLENVILEFDYFVIHQLHNSIFEIISHDNSSFLIDILSKNKTVKTVPSNYRYIGYLHDEICFYGTNKFTALTTLFDCQLNEIIPPKYKFFNHLEKGTNIIFPTDVNDKMGAINTKNQIIIPFDYKFLMFLHDNIKLPRIIISMDFNLKMDLWSESGHKITDQKFEFISPIYNDHKFYDSKRNTKDYFYLVKSNGFYGVINIKSGIK